MSPHTSQHRPCEKCKAPMVFTRIKPARLGFDLQTFECSNCGRVETVTTETLARKWVDSGLMPPV